MTTIDLSLSPWDRLAKLAPPGTHADDLQSAAGRWSLTADVYNAAADLWEEKLLGIDLSPDPNLTVDTNNPLASGHVSSIMQDGIRVEYSVSVQGGNSQNARRSQANQILKIVRTLRAKGKPYSPLVHSKRYNPWRNMPVCRCWCHNANGVPNTSFDQDETDNWWVEGGQGCACSCGQFIIIDDGV